MNPAASDGAIGVLASGGLDSSILVAHLLDRGRRVRPFYIRTGLVWQEHELAALRRLLRAIGGRRLAELVVLELPLSDLYGDHWSMTGRNTPAADTPDEAVFLPGRNALLLIKAAIWCQLHGVGELALAPLGTSPFADASDEFLDDFQAALNHGGIGQLSLLRPFGKMTKRQVMELGRNVPLELTFSCISPVDHLHCGRCNKCAERQSAFRDADMKDGTRYAT
ncbi:MAG TPA: 7-cyano-7-deazaguanine synthase [Pirellulaceae bacterium]|nr:7-cyano-7-deazaguanine synthase [Pirellulaceae bacterium]